MHQFLQACNGSRRWRLSCADGALRPAYHHYGANNLQHSINTTYKLIRLQISDASDPDPKRQKQPAQRRHSHCCKCAPAAVYSNSWTFLDSDHAAPQKKPPYEASLWTYTSRDSRFLLDYDNDFQSGLSPYSPPSLEF